MSRISFGKPETQPSAAIEAGREVKKLETFSHHASDAWIAFCALAIISDLQSGKNTR